MILCPRCGKDSLVRVGDPIQPPQQMFVADTFGPTRLTAVNSGPVYPVRCIGRVRTANPYYHHMAMLISGRVEVVEERYVPCDWWGNLSGHDTELLLEQIVRRTGNTEV